MGCPYNGGCITLLIEKHISIFMNATGKILFRKCKNSKTHSQFSTNISSFKICFRENVRYIMYTKPVLITLPKECYRAGPQMRLGSEFLDQR